MAFWWGNTSTRAASHMASLPLPLSRPALLRKNAGEGRQANPFVSEKSPESEVQDLGLVDGRIGQLDHGAVIVQGIAGTELRDRGENSFQRRSLGRRRFQAKVLEEISQGILGLGNAIGHEDEAIPRLELAAGALKGGIGQQAHRYIAVGRTHYFAATDQ